MQRNPQTFHDNESLPGWFMPLFTALWIVSLLMSLGVMELRGEESRRVLVSLEMLFSGEYLQPTLSGWPYYNKPPLFNWLLAGWMHLFGTESIFLLRLPTILAIGLMSVAIYKFSRQTLGQPVALLASLIWMTGSELYFYGSILAIEMDVFYALIVTLQWMFFYVGWKRNSPLWAFLPSYLLMAAGFMMKGMPSFLFQGFTLLAWLIAMGQWRWLLRWEHLLSLAVGLLGSFFYFIYLDQQGGEAWIYLFNLLEESSKKSASESTFFSILIQIFSFPIKGIQLLAPWVLLLFFIPWKNLRPIFRENHLLYFCLIVILANIWVYWISPGSRCRYLYMFVPFLALLLADLSLRSGRIKIKWIILLALGMVTLRILYNLILLPVQRENMVNQQHYRAFAVEVLSHASKQSLSYVGTPDTLFINPRLGLLSLMEDTVLISPKVPFLTLMEITRQQKSVLHFDTLSSPGPTLILSNDRIPDHLPAVSQMATFDGDSLYLYLIPAHKRFK